MLQAHAHEATRARAKSAPAPARLRGLRARREARCNLRWPSARGSARAALPVLLTACALLPRCRQPQLREVWLDGHRALDISDTTGRRDVDTMFTRIRPSSRPRALPLGQAARSLCLRSLCLCAGRGRPRGCGPDGALLNPHTIEYGPVDSGLVIGAMKATASTTAASTPAPPLATGPPHHRLSHDASPHSPV